MAGPSVSQSVSVCDQLSTNDTDTKYCTAACSGGGGGGGVGGVGVRELFESFVALRSTGTWCVSKKEKIKYDNLPVRST